LTLREDNGRETTDIIRFSLDEILLNMQQRPSANAIRVELDVAKMKLFGMRSNSEIPLLLRNLPQDNETNDLSLLSLVFETNPLKKPGVNQDIALVMGASEIIYDVLTVKKSIAFFRPPEDVILQDLQEKAYETFEDFKVNTTAGLLYAMDQRNICDVNVTVNASYLLIPQNGVMAGCTDMVVIDFGQLQVQSDPNQQRILDLKDMDPDEIADNAYDKFLLNMTALQVFLCKEGEDWKAIRRESSSILHLLYPVCFQGSISKAILPQDPRLKQLCVSGVLSQLHIAVSDDKIARLVKLADSLPSPVPEAEPQFTGADELPRVPRSRSSSVSSSAPDRLLRVERRTNLDVPSILPLNTSTSPVDDSFHTAEEESRITNITERLLYRHCKSS